jgi:hypothetical protein
MPQTIHISARAAGTRKPLFADFSVPLPPGVDGEGGGGGLTLRDLIAHVVRHEVDTFRDRQEARKLDRVLSPGQIAHGLASGKVDPAGKDLKQSVDVDQAIAAAITGFEDGLYLVLIDGEEQRELDRQVFLQSDSKLTFIRLVFLAGA